MIRKLILATIIAIVVAIGCEFAGGLLVDLDITIASKVGYFMVKFDDLFGVLAGMWYFLSGKNRA